MPQNQFRLRMPEPVRDGIEQAAQRSGQSINSEIVQRLDRSLHQERIYGSREMADLAITMAATFIVDTQGKDWTTDQHAYGLGVAGVLDALLRRVPPGPDRWVTIEGIVSRLLTVLANARLEHQEKKQTQKREAAA